MIRRGSLSGRREFERVRAQGRRASAGPLTVMGAPRSGGERGRLGLAVAARGVRAVGRNRIRRRLRAAFAETAAPTDWDFVVRARKEAGTISFQLLVRDLGRAVAAVTRKGFR